MSQKKRRNAPLPASSAGLLRFFEDDTPGIRVRPEITVGLGISLIAISIVLLYLASIHVLVT